MPYLNCPSCGLTLAMRRPEAEIEHCPRCLANARRAVGLFVSAKPRGRRPTPTNPKTRTRADVAQSSVHMIADTAAPASEALDTEPARGGLGDGSPHPPAGKSLRNPAAESRSGQTRPYEERS